MYLTESMSDWKKKQIYYNTSNVYNVSKRKPCTYTLHLQLFTIQELYDDNVILCCIPTQHVIKFDTPKSRDHRLLCVLSQLFCVVATIFLSYHWRKVI